MVLDERVLHWDNVQGNKAPIELTIPKTKEAEEVFHEYHMDNLADHKAETRCRFFDKEALSNR